VADPFFSIITPSFNHAHFIEQTILSVLKQGEHSFEHIIMDGGSTDETVEILKKYDHLIWTSHKDDGQSNAINEGIAKARGTMITWLNSDDLLCEGALETVRRYCTDTDKPVLMYGDIDMIDTQSNWLGEITGALLKKNLLVRCPDYVRQPGTFFSRALWEQAGSLREDLHLVFDFDFFLRALDIASTTYIPNTLAKFRYYKENKSLSMNQKQAREIYTVLRSHKLLSVDNSWFCLKRLAQHTPIYNTAKCIRDFVHARVQKET